MRETIIIYRWQVSQINRKTEVTQTDDSDTDMSSRDKADHVTQPLVTQIPPVT